MLPPPQLLLLQHPHNRLWRVNCRYLRFPLRLFLFLPSEHQTGQRPYSFPPLYQMIPRAHQIDRLPLPLPEPYR